MQRKAQLLKMIKEGHREFQPVDGKPSSIQQFQVDAKLLVSAEHERLLGTLAILPDHDGGVSNIVAVAVNDGLTHAGEQFLKKHLGA